MPRSKRQRAVTYDIIANGGRWQGWVQTGIDADGKPIRAHRTATFCAACKASPTRGCPDCYKRCEDRMREVEDAVAAGRRVEKTVRNPGAVQALTEFLAECQERVDAGTMAYHTLRSYRLMIESRTLPRVRDIRIRRLDKARIEDILRELKRTVSASAARKTLAVLRIALNWTVAKEYVDRNEADLVKMPSLGEDQAEIDPLSEEEFALIVPVAWRRTQRRARWLMAMVHGKRQSECLGLDVFVADHPRLPSDVNLKKGTATIREKVERRFWRHGCDDPHACAATRPDPLRPGKYLPNLHRTKACPPRWQHGCGGDPSACTGNRVDRCPQRRPLAGCRDHRGAAGCPPPCAPKCTKHAASCPQRRDGGLRKARTKSRKSSHTIVLDPLVVKAFELDLADREAWKARAGSKWKDSGAVFVTEFGSRVDPRRDWDELQDILTEAGLPPARVHALRHTAATNMLAAGLDKRVVMELMGWSQDQSSRYQHVVEKIQRGATAQLGAWLRNAGALVDPEPAMSPEPNPADTATTPLPDDLGNVLPFRRRAV